MKILILFFKTTKSQRNSEQHLPKIDFKKHEIDEKRSYNVCGEDQPEKCAF